MMIDPISRYLHRSAGQHGPIILMYHSVVPGRGRPSWRWAVSRAAFQAQLDYLRNEGWQTVNIRDVGSQKTLKPRTVTLTFDDGYADNHDAFDDLAKREMVATWYIVSNSIGRMSTWDDPGVSRKPMLSAEQLSTMAAAGMEIGSHSHSHARLIDLDDGRLQEEVATSKARLEELLNSHAVESFAYPYGLHDDRVVDAVRSAGFKTACITRPGWAVGNDPLRIRRVSIFAGDSLATFARKLAFADNDVSWTHMARYFGARLLARFSV